MFWRKIKALMSDTSEDQRINQGSNYNNHLMGF